MDDRSLSLLGEATPYFYIGDSHAASIESLAFEQSEPKALVATNIISIWRFVASDLLEQDGLLADAFMLALRRTGAFHSSPAFAQLPGFRPVLTTYGLEKRVEQLALSSFANERPYVLCVGEINTRYILHRLVSDEMDFEVPFSTAGLDAFPASSARQVLRADQMMRIIADDFAPLFRGLRILREAGLKSVFLHSLPPPTTDEADALRVLQHPSPVRVRYKLAMLVNYMYAAFCKQLDIGFINTWPLVTKNDVLDEAYYLDGLHLNRKHAVLSVAEVHRHMKEITK